MEPQISIVCADEMALVAMPIREDWILAGAPLARGKVTLQSADRRQCAGVWECTAGEFHWNFEYDETVRILDGEVRIQHSDGVQVVLRTGDMAHFPRGARTRWKVEKMVRKVFFLFSERPF